MTEPFHESMYATSPHTQGWQASIGVLGRDPANCLAVYAERISFMVSMDAFHLSLNLTSAECLKLADMLVRGAATIATSPAIVSSPVETESEDA